MIEYQEKEHTMQNMPIAIFRGDDTDALGYQTIVGTIRTDLDLTGCRAVFKYLSFSVEFNPIPEDKKLTVIIPASETKKFPPGLGYASLRVYDAEGKLCTFSNRIMVFVATKTPMFGNAEFEVDFNVRPELEPLKIFVGPNPDDFDEYRGFLEKVIDRASAEKYGLSMLLDAIDSSLGANDGVAATPAAVKAAYAAVIGKLTDEYYTKDETEEAIDRVAAYYITYDAAGNPFPTYAALANATTVYSGGSVRTPTRNDYCVVLADETHDNAEYRYIYAVAEGETTGRWQPQFPVEGVMTVDQSVTKDSQNPVSGGGVWSAIWGALTALPGFSSIYDWVVATFRNKTDLNVYDDNSRVWTISNCTAPGLGNAINGRYVYSASEQKWLKDGVTDFYIYRSAGQWVLFVQLQGDLPVWTTDSAQGVSGTISMTGGMTARYTIDVATSWETTDTLAKSSQLAGKLDKSGGAASDLLICGTNKAIKFNDDLLYIYSKINDAWITQNVWDLRTSQDGNVAFLSDIYAAVQQIAPEWVSGTAYTAKMLVTYDGVVYRCKADTVSPHTATPNVDTRHWEAKRVSDLFVPLTGGTMTGRLDIEHLNSTGEVYFLAFAAGDIPLTLLLGFDGSRYFFLQNSAKVYLPVHDGTIALTAGTGHEGNLASLDANGNPTDSQIPSANVATKGEIPYDRITITTGQLQNHAVQKVTLNAATTTLTLPVLTDLTGKVSDFGIDVVNSYEVSGTPTAASFSLAGTIGTDYNLIVPEGEDWSEMSALAAGEMAVYYFSLSAFQINDKPTWEVMKKVVELVPVPVVP